MAQVDELTREVVTDAFLNGCEFDTMVQGVVLGLDCTKQEARQMVQAVIDEIMDSRVMAETGLPTILS